MKHLLILLFIINSVYSNSDNHNQDKPNILFIYSDDHTFQAVSAYESFLSGVVETPNLDRIANEGMLFENAFNTNSICTPARATVLTGKYGHNNGLNTLDRAFDGSQQTFPKLLQKAGYYTAVVGKWHLKTMPTGFDYYNIMPVQGRYFNPIMTHTGMPWYQVPGGDPDIPYWRVEMDKPGGLYSKGIKEYKGHVTDVVTDISLDVLKNRPKDKPFMIMYQHKAPHDLFEYDKKYAELYKDIDIPEPISLNDNYDNRSTAIKRTIQKVHMEYGDEFSEAVEDGEVIPKQDRYLFFPTLEYLHQYLHENKTDEFDDDLKLIKSNDNKLKKIIKSIFGNNKNNKTNLSIEDRRALAYQMYIKAYLRCVAGIDENVGRVLDYLDKEGLSENTIVIYTSDQGFFLGEHNLFDKRFMYEESLRVPLLVRYPKIIKPGSITTDFAINTDLAPTFLDLAGVDIPEDMDGVSFKPVLEGNTPDDWQTDMYYRYWMHRAHFNIPAHYGIRTERYKLIFYYGLPLDAKGSYQISTTPEWELFDLEKDPNEMNNVYNDPNYSNIIKDLKVRLLELKDKYGDQDEKYPELISVRKKFW